MPLNNAKHQRGFTLIEMSIVLVIIGLIVGGILKGQEIIESARQKNMANLWDQLKAGQNTFLDRYRALPGDYTRADTQINANISPGNGDGYVGGLLATAAAIQGADGVGAGERLDYFNSLIGAGLFGGGQINKAPSAFSGGATLSPLPAGPWSQTGLTVAHGTHDTDGTVASAKTTVWLRLQAYGATALPALPGAAAFQLDQKFDDGLPQTGRIRNSNVSNTTICGGTDYSVVASAGAKECEVLFSME